MKIHRLKRGIKLIRRYGFGRRRGTAHYECDVTYRLHISKHDLQNMTLPQLKMVLDIKLQNAISSMVEFIEEKRKEIAEDPAGVDLN